MNAVKETMVPTTGRPEWWKPRSFRLWKLVVFTVFGFVFVLVLGSYLGAQVGNDPNRLRVTVGLAGGFLFVGSALHVLGSSRELEKRKEGLAAAGNVLNVVGSGFALIFALRG